MRKTLTGVLFFVIAAVFSLNAAASSFDEYKEDFSSGEYKVGDSLDGMGATAFEEMWLIKQAALDTEWGGSITVVEDKGSKAFRFYGYGQAVFSQPFDAVNDESYEVEYRLKVGDVGKDIYALYGIFVRGTNLVPGQSYYSRRYCGYQDGEYRLFEYTYFETDYNTNRLNDPEYKAKLEDDGDFDFYTYNYLGGSGLGIVPLKLDGQNLLRIYIRLHDERYDGGLGVWSNDFNVDFNVFDYFNLKIVDKASSISIYANEKLICSVEYSGVTKYENSKSIHADEGDTSIYRDPISEFFEKAVVKDGEGKQIANLTNTLLAVNGYLALSTRHSGQVDVAEIVIKSTIEKPQETSTEEPENTPAPTDDEDDSTPIPTQTKETGSEKDKRRSVGLIAGIVIVAIAAVACVVLLMVIKKKKV